MSKEELGAACCRQRFKGIENFLKRVAFNLGNTPSQTEVKVISCIPIDVTDLQQKIIHLEKQLDEVRGPAQQSSKQSKVMRTSVNTALLNSHFPRVSTAAISCKSLDCDQSTSPTCLNPKKKSNVSFTFPDTSLTNAILENPWENPYTSQGPEDKTNNLETDEDDTITEMCEPKPQEHLRNFFKKRKKFMKCKKIKSPCVYYAQTINSPFTRSDMTQDTPKKEESDVMSRSYLAKMINKQYKPKRLDDTSRISEFSSPVCRDVTPRCGSSCRLESDICSCCHGPYQNIDNQLGRFNNPLTYMVNEMNTGSAYYDTNLYDLVPVKEKPVKIKKDDRNIPRRKEPRPRIHIKCWPENIRTKQYRYYSYPLPSARLRSDHSSRDRFVGYVRKTPLKHRMEPIAKKVVKRRKEMKRPISITTSKSCSIDFGTVYPKKVFDKAKKEKKTTPIPVPRKNVECVTTVINNSECQTAMSSLEAKLSDAKTEATLNQIKSILQSVLAEVKGSQVKSLSTPEKPKKDAVVQKGPSQGHMQTSSLMNSITYSPYAMSPSPFMASCSRQLNPSQFYYPHSAMKCFQNFPLFIQGTGRHMCSCYRNSSHAKSGYMKQATTIATNTDDVTEARSKETEKLIKEIYKSMALTMDMPNKDTSLSEYDEIIKSVHGFPSPFYAKPEPKKHPKKIRNVVQAVSELFIKKEIVDLSEAPKSTIEQQSKITSNDTSTQSHLVTTDTDIRLRKDRLEHYLRMRNKESEQAEAEKRNFRDMLIQNATTITETDTSSSDAESDTTLVMPKEVMEQKHKKEKQGLFTKMFKSVKLFKPKDKAKKDVISETEEESLSDSDDYQTVYSQKIDKAVKHKPRAHNMPKHKTHSKISYKQVYQRDKSPEKRKTPYMEQEYRRYWNERLMFHENGAPRQSSELVYSEQTTPQRSTYYQSYEARNAFVEPIKIRTDKDERRKDRIIEDDNETKAESKKTRPSKGFAWLKKHKMGIHCGEQWKKFILEG